MKTIPFEYGVDDKSTDNDYNNDDSTNMIYEHDLRTCIHEYDYNMFAGSIIIN
jgi:hypothetical protein